MFVILFLLPHIMLHNTSWHLSISNPHQPVHNQVTASLLMSVSASVTTVSAPADSLLCIAHGEPLQTCIFFSTKGLTDSLFYTTVQRLIKKGNTTVYIVEDTDVGGNIKAKYFMFQEAEPTIYAAISCVQWHSHSGVLSQLNICYLITVEVVYAKIYCYLLISVLTQLH